MTHGDLDDFEYLPTGIVLINGYKVFMLPFVRAVICPDATLVFVAPKDMTSAFMDLQSWALPITSKQINQ